MFYYIIILKTIIYKWKKSGNSQKKKKLQHLSFQKLIISFKKCDIVEESNILPERKKKFSSKCVKRKNIMWKKSFGFTSWAKQFCSCQKHITGLDNSSYRVHPSITSKPYIVRTRCDYNTKGTKKKNPHMGYYTTDEYVNFVHSQQIRR